MKSTIHRFLFLFLFPALVLGDDHSPTPLAENTIPSHSRANHRPQAELPKRFKFKTKNFIVEADSMELAQEFAETAETVRKQLAEDWLGKELPDWKEPIPIVAKCGPRYGAGGASHFTFIEKRLSSFRMEVQGCRERVNDSVIPHEVLHAVFASHFGQPLPRWVDEGACTSIECLSERLKMEKLLIAFMNEGKSLPLNLLLTQKNYPETHAEILKLYAEGHSLVQFLLQRGDKKKFVAFVDDVLKDKKVEQAKNWETHFKNHYQFESLVDLRNQWIEWIYRDAKPRQGS